MIRTTILALGTLAGLALTTQSASAQVFAPPASNYSYYPSTTVVTPVSGYYTAPVVYGSPYYAPRVVYPYSYGYAPAYRYGYRSGYGYRNGVSVRVGIGGGRGWRW